MLMKKYPIYIFMVTFWVTIGISLQAYGIDEYITRDLIDDSKEITQGKLAVILVDSVGLESELPIAPITEDYIKILDKNGIRPLGGWVLNKMVTIGDFAVILARVMGLETRLVPPQEIYKENRNYIQLVWETQYRIDGYYKDLRTLLQDPRFFPAGPPVCPYGLEYADKDGDYVIDMDMIEPGEMELYPTVKYIYTLERRGVMLEGPAPKILTVRLMKAAFRSPIFRSAPGYALVHDYKKEFRFAEEHITPITPGGP